MASCGKALGRKLSKIQEKDIKCVFLGDSAVGKTKLICSYVYNHPKRKVEFLIKKRHMPSIFAFDSVALATNKRIRYRIGKRVATLHIWDTFGDHEKDREYSCKNADIVILCFNINSRSSFFNVYDKWFPEIQMYCPKVPVILVGTQADRRHNDASLYEPNQEKYFSLQEYLNHENYEPVATHLSTTEGLVEPGLARIMAQNINALAYFETSVATKYGVNELFRKALKIGLAKKLNKLDGLISKEILLQQPFVPPPIPYPNIYVPGFYDTKFSEYFHDFCDVKFLVYNYEVKCHRVLLAMGSNFFYELFLAIENNESIDNFPVSFQNVSNSNGILTFKIEGVNTEYFAIILNFLCTGQLCIASKEEWILFERSIRVLGMQDEFKSIIYSMDEKICFDENENINEEFFPVILDNREKRLKFINNEFLSDCEIYVADVVVHVHRCVVTSHCDVLKAMLQNNNFLEGQISKVDFRNTSLESFLALLEYLYTGNCGYYGDLHGTLELANFLCLPRLVALCEEEIVKYIKNMDSEGDKEVYSAVLASYQLAQFHNAPQLSAWCLHFMAVNYNPMCKEQTREMKSLEPSCLKHLEENRWPPVWYLKEQDYYERTMDRIEREKSLKKNKKRRKYHASCFH